VVGGVGWRGLGDQHDADTLRLQFDVRDDITFMPDVAAGEPLAVEELLGQSAAQHTLEPRPQCCIV
jgi:hypothetical protein